MNYTSAKAYFFSPTGTTKKITTQVCNSLEIKDTQYFDVTLLRTNTETQLLSTTDLAIFAVPVYSGRVPAVATQRLSAIKGDQTPAVVVAVYGNRAFDDTLLELHDIVEKQGFKVIAGASFIGEHSFSDNNHPIAAGRPDKADKEAATHFAQLIQEKLNQASTLSDIITPQIPGNTIYRAGMNANTVAPITDTNLCTLCGKCVEVCPTGAITLNGKIETDGAKCILCCACVKVCSDNARIAEDKLFTMATEKLFANCKERREPEFFL